MRHVPAIIAGTLGLSLLICLGMRGFFTIKQAKDPSLRIKECIWEVTYGQ